MKNLHTITQTWKGRCEGVQERAAGARKTMRDNTVEGRLERIEKSLDALFVGLIKQRKQVGAGVAVNVAGHMLAAKARKKR